LLFPKIIKGIKQLNTIRNKVAHKLIYELQDSGLSEMLVVLHHIPQSYLEDQMLKIFKIKGFKFKNFPPVGIINSFTAFAIGYLGPIVEKEPKKS